MPTVIENVCCGVRQDCITQGPQFPVYCLDKGALHIANWICNDIFEDVEVVNNDNLRHSAYRNFIMWQLGRLGRGNRMVLPSCVVLSIRRQYPDFHKVYTGFIAGQPPA